MVKSRFFWLFILIFHNQVNSQSYFKIYDSIKKSKEKNLIALTDSLMEKAFSEKQYKVSARIAHDSSVENFKRRNYERAVFYGKKELYYLDLIGEKNEVYIKALYQLGLFFRYNNEYEASIETQFKVINLNLDQIRVAQSYGSIGRTLHLKGQYNKAIDFYKKSTQLLETLQSYRSLYTEYLGLASVYFRLGDNKSLLKGLEELRKAEDLQSKIKFSTRMKVLLYNRYGNIYNLLGKENFSKAKYFYKKNIDLNKNSSSKLFLGRAYLNLADLYNKYKKDSAGYYAVNSIPLVKSSLIDLTSSYLNYADYLIDQEKYQEAVLEIEKALKINFKKNKELESYSKNELYSIANKRGALVSLKKICEALMYLYDKNKDAILLERILKTSEVYNNIALIIYEVSNNDYTKLFWSKEASQAYLQGAYAAHLLGDSEAAFSFMEKNKALLLSESILKNTEFQNLPKNVSDQETSLQRQIYQLENKLSKNESNTILQDALFNVKLTHENYVDSLKTVYPKYFDRKIDVEQISLLQVQKELKNDEAIVSYILNKFDEEKEILLGLVTTNSSSKTFEVANADSLRPKLLRYRELISKPFSTKEHQHEYQRLAFELYLELFPSQEIRNLVRGKNLTIIPDGDLQNIPFEAFITKENSNHYLILDSSVSYAYSYSFLKHNEQVQRETNEAFIGYSPVEFTSLALPRLKDSKREVEQVNDQFDGIAKFQETATKKDFLTTSSQSKIIHLATHSDAGGNPWIAFADEKLELHELYTYKNNADLVTLSACNTSLGEVAKGEGVLSLARGFFYSGSKSVVSSLWKVNDKSTSDIMIDFYKNIKEGQSKSEALNNAKRTYINSHELSEQSPYYWSSFILIGDAGQIDLTNNTYLYLVIGFIVIILFLFLRKKRFSKG